MGRCTCFLDFILRTRFADPYNPKGSKGSRSQMKVRFINDSVSCMSEGSMF